MDDKKKCVSFGGHWSGAHIQARSRSHTHTHIHPHHIPRPLLAGPSTSHDRWLIGWALKAKHIGRKRTPTRRAQKKKKRPEKCAFTLNSYLRVPQYSITGIRIELYIGLVSSTREIDADYGARMEWVRSANEFAVDSDAHSRWPYGCTTGLCEPLSGKH